MLMLFVTITCVLTKFIEGRAFCFLLFIKVLFICSILSARPAMIQTHTAQVIIIDDFHPVFLDNLRDAGITYHYQPDFKAADAPDQLLNYPIIAVRSKIQFNQNLIDQLPDLKCIARGGAGMDNIDESYALGKNITLLNAPEGNRDAVAEHTIGLLLGMSKKIVKSHNEVSQFQWQREANRGWEIKGKTIGIIGFGNTGSSVAKKLSGFDCEVITYDKYLSNIESSYASQVPLDTLLAQSDVISFHIPLTAETEGMLGENLITQMKNGVVLINTSRGMVANLSAIWQGIKGGKISSYACDVLENENFDRLSKEEKTLITEMTSENQVIITPHVAGWSTESYFKIATVLSEKIKGFTIKAKNI
jgi:D-3-phosphoglycerate dehydrogenase